MDGDGLATEGVEIVEAHAPASDPEEVCLGWHGIVVHSSTAHLWNNSRCFPGAGFF